MLRSVPLLIRNGSPERTLQEQEDAAVSNTTHPVLFALAIALLPTAGQAQQGPSFDCEDSDTATELAICASPELSAIEMQMFLAYQDLVSRVGQREARRLADELLAPRQACEGNAACIAQRLLISMEVFRRTGAGDTEMAATEPPSEELEPPAARPEGDQADGSLDSVPLPPARPAMQSEARGPALASAGPALEAIPVPPSREAAAPPDEPTVQASIKPRPAETPGATPENVEQASFEAAQDPSEEAVFDTPMFWAFMDRSREERASIQAILAVAGLYDGSADGRWDRWTEEALTAFAAGPGGQAFDLSTREGASQALDHITSESYGAAYRFSFLTGGGAHAAGGEVETPGEPMEVTSTEDTPELTAEPLSDGDW